MSTTVLYLGTPGTGKSTLMRSHVLALAKRPDAPLFFVIDRGSQPGKPPIWDSIGPGYTSTRDWWTSPAPIARFVGVPGEDVARLAINVGWSCLVDDEVTLSIGRWDKSAIQTIVKEGHHLRNRAGLMTSVSAMLATQRPGSLPADIIGCFSRVYLGRVQSFNDAERVYKEGWVPGVTSARDALSVLVARQPGEFSAWP